MRPRIMQQHVKIRRTSLRLDSKYTIGLTGGLFSCINLQLAPTVPSCVTASTTRKSGSGHVVIYASV